jgi:predicted HTH domain antitoxin
MTFIGSFVAALENGNNVKGGTPMRDSEGLVEDQSMVSWELRQLVKSGLYPDERAALRSALRALFRLHPQTKLRMIISAYEAGDISLGKAAAMLGVSQEEMKDILREEGAEIHLGPQTIEELLEDARNA